MEQKNILLLTRPISPPWDEASKNLAVYLSKNLDIPNTHLTLLTTKVKMDGFPPNVNLIPIHKTKSLNIASKIKIFFHLITTETDIVHSLFVATPATGIIINIIKHIKKFKTIQTVAAFSHHARIFSFSIFGDVVVCFSYVSATKLIKGNRKVIIIPPGIPLNIFKPQKKENIIAFLGELYRLGSYDIVADLLSMLTKSLPDYKIVLGFRTTRKPKQENEFVNKLKKRWSTNPKVQFTDIINDMPEFLGKIKMVIVPATQATGKFDYPLVLLEALAAGTPIVISSIGAFSELGQFPGVIIPKENTASAFHKTITLSLKHIRKLSVDARLTAEKNFDIKSVVKKYEALYQKILS